MKLKYIIIAIGFVLSFLGGNAQNLNSSVISNCGEEQSNGTLKLNYTVGETAIIPFSVGNTNLHQGFHQPTCATNGRIIGCDFVCAGDQNSTYTYTAEFDGFVRDITWSVSSPDATIIANNGNTVDVQFLNWPSVSNTVTLIANASNSCDGTPIEFLVELDNECVFPGDVNLDNITDNVGFVSDMSALAYATSQYSFYIYSNPTYIPPERKIPCNLGTTYTWGGHPSDFWGPTFMYNNTTLDMKHADCNGDGLIQDTKSSFFYNGTTPPITDADVIIYNLNATHNGNSTLKNTNEIPGLFLTKMDSILPNGNEIRLMVTLGELTEPILDVHSIAFIVEFNLGTFNSPVVHKYSSNLAPPGDLKLIDYPILDGNGPSANPRWYVCLSKLDPFNGTNFSGEELCHVECHATIAGFNADYLKTYNSLDSIPIEISIVDAGFISSDGTFTPIAGNSTTVYVKGDAPTLNAKAILGGPYDETTGLMNDDLRQNGFIPLEEPYTNLGFNHINSGGEEIASTVLDVQGTDAIVDWVFLEFRSCEDSSVIDYTKVGLIQCDGDIVDVDGVSPLKLSRLIPGEYFVSLKHRNHLGVMANEKLLLTRDGSFIDFTQTNLYGTSSSNIVNGKQTLWEGDTNNSGRIDVADRTNAWNTRNQTGYLPADCNLDGNVNATDRIITWNHRNKEAQLP